MIRLGSYIGNALFREVLFGTTVFFLILQASCVHNTRDNKPHATRSTESGCLPSEGTWNASEVGVARRVTHSYLCYIHTHLTHLTARPLRHCNSQHNTRAGTAHSNQHIYIYIYRGETQRVQWYILLILVLRKYHVIAHEFQHVLERCRGQHAHAIILRNN